MIKSWHLHKSDHKFDITINGVNANGIDAEIQIDNDKTVEIDEIKGNGALRYIGISILLSCLSKYQPHKEFCTGTGFVIKIGLPSHDSSIFISTFEYLLLLASLSYATKLRENHQSPYP